MKDATPPIAPAGIEAPTIATANLVPYLRRGLRHEAGIAARNVAGFMLEFDVALTEECNRFAELFKSAHDLLAAITLRPDELQEDIELDLSSIKGLVTLKALAREHNIAVTRLDGDKSYGPRRQAVREEVHGLGELLMAVSLRLHRRGQRQIAVVSPRDRHSCRERPVRTTIGSRGRR